jgi:molecular chaperone DnaK (HSP70)
MYSQHKVAYGAAVQAANLSLTAEQKEETPLSGLTLMDVTPLSLGIGLLQHHFF